MQTSWLCLPRSADFVVRLPRSMRTCRARLFAADDPSVRSASKAASSPPKHTSSGWL